MPKAAARNAGAATGAKTLIIAEKPSVAQDLMKVLPGKFEKHDSYWEGEGHIVSFALGHLVSLATPKDMDDRHKSWSLDNLPIIPEKFSIKALPKTKGQLAAIAKLMRRKDVGEIINACDAGREGELIFRYILQFVSEGKPVKAPVKRLWLQSMTKTAMEEGLRNLRSDEEMLNLAAAAQSRSEADWLVGINGSRALTGYQSRRGGFFLTPCGRVQTPTLSMIVRREEERNKFVARDYFEVHGTFALSDKQTYEGRWFDPEFKKQEGDDALRADRLWDEARADAIAAKCQGKPAKVTETQKPVTQSCPGLYDLTTLQREANGRFGFSAKTTLSIAQALYERHKALTYPRTDSRHLPEDYLPTVKGLMKTLQGGEYGRFAAEALDKNYVRMDKKIFDGAKVSDHFAIIPTQVIPEGLSDAERKIYQMVTQRFIAVFFPVARFLQTTRLSVVEGESFRTEGKVLEYAGWKAIYGADIDDDKETALPALPADGKAVAKEIRVRADRTRPPARLTESTLLSFMESAGKYVEDEELRDAMKERGLGTPATRAATIEGLIDDKYVVREGKELVPTAKGIELLGLLSAMKIEELTLPELTGEWEYKLNRIEKGKLTREEFMGETEKLTREIVTRIKGYDEDKDRKEAGFINPIDGKPMSETTSRWQSADGKIVIRKVMGGRQMAPEEIIELLEKKRLGPLSGFRSKAGKPFAAALRLTDANKVEFVFDEADGEKPEIVNPEPLGKSPADGSPVFETVSSYMSQTAIDGDKTGFKLGKSILGKTLDRENIAKMLNEGRSALIQGFQSSKTRRFFDAYLKLNKTGKLEFEFPPREFKGRGKGGFKKKAATDAEE